MFKLHLLALSCSLLALGWCIMAREPLHAALAADLERLGHDAAAVAAGTWPTRMTGVCSFSEAGHSMRFLVPSKRTPRQCV